MRERLTAAFAALAMVVLVGAGFILGVATDDEQASLEDDQVRQLATAVAAVVTGALAGGSPVDGAVLAPFANGDVRVVFDAGGSSSPVTAGGEGSPTGSR